jgi:hypothetical protein
MKSVIRALKPDGIYFIHEEYPKIDKFSYYSWLDELRKDYAFIWLKKTGTHLCSLFGEQRIKLITEELSKRGGFYVHENTILTPAVNLLRTKQVNGIRNDTGRGFLIAQRGVRFRPNINVTCTDGRDNSYQSTSYCHNTNVAIYPKDIWESNDTTGQLMRWAAYGDASVLRAEPNYTELAPNIAHFMWVGRGTMDFMMYLSLLSLIYVAEMDMVYIHGEEPIGPFWDKIKDHDRIKIIYRSPEVSVYGQRANVKAHRSDVWRADVLLKYGGLYVDTDVIIVKPLSEHIRAYDAVISLDISLPRHIDLFPYILQNGVMLGKPGATFWVQYQQSMRVYNDKLWAWNSCFLPYKIKERHPRNLLIDPRLQVLCIGLHCHPTWWPNFTTKAVHHLNTNSLPNWRNDAYTYHFAGNTFPFRNEDWLRKSKSVVAEIGRYVMQKAGLWGG